MNRYEILNLINEELLRFTFEELKEVYQILQNYNKKDDEIYVDVWDVWDKLQENEVRMKNNIADNYYRTGIKMIEESGKYDTHYKYRWYFKKKDD